LTFEASDVDGLMQEALEKVTGHIRTADRVVFLLQEGRQFSIKASHGGRPGRELPVERVSRAILRRVRRTGRTLFLSDALADTGLGPRRSIQEIGQRSVICAPLKAKGKVVGLVYADTVSVIAAFTPAHLKWVNRMTESLNEQLGPLIPEHMETMLEEHTMAPGDDPETDLIVPGIRKVVVPSLPSSAVAASNLAAAEVVFAPDQTPLDLARSKAATAKAKAKAKAKAPLSLLDLATFYRGLSSMLTAGITVHRALDVLGEQSSGLAPVARSLHSDVVNGHRLSLAMGRFPHIFSAVQRALIRVGEETGSLDILAQSLAAHVEGRMGIRAKVVAALTYPVLVTIFCLIGCLLAPPLFLNDFFETLKATGVRLPLVTRVVMAIVNAICSPVTWVVIGGLVILLRLVWKRMLASPKWAKRLEWRLLRVPIIGPIRQAFFLLDFMQTLALQLEAGLRLDKSLLLSATVSGNAYLQEQTLWVVDHVKSGATLSYSLHRSKVFPRTVVEFVALGEETGKMSDSLRFAEALLRERAESALETAESVMEPLAICLVGVLVGVLALACMLPLVRMFEAFL
jgi:type IV pilus assembly protein PilC